MSSYLDAVEILPLGDVIVVHPKLLQYGTVLLRA
jgi:hypothetical protein